MQICGHYETQTTLYISSEVVTGQVNIVTWRCDIVGCCTGSWGGETWTRTSSWTGRRWRTRSSSGGGSSAPWSWPGRSPSPSAGISRSWPPPRGCIQPGMVLFIVTINSKSEFNIQFLKVVYPQYTEIVLYWLGLPCKNINVHTEGSNELENFHQSAGYFSSEAHLGSPDNAVSITQTVVDVGAALSSSSYFTAWICFI